MPRVELRLLALALIACVSGCASQPSEEFEASEPQAAARAEQAPNAEFAAEAAPAEERPERSLAEIERELASNEARLRELGVQLPGVQPPADTSAVAGGERVEQPKPEKKKRDATSKGKPGAGPAKPSATPSAPAQPKPDALDDDRAASRKDKGDAPATEDRFAPPPPEAAKAAPPTGNPTELDAATRCLQVCELGQITCELSVQICELADRHDGEDDYRAACERSADDCSAAQEACNACEA